MFFFLNASATTEIYTVSKDSLLRIRELADKKESLIHIHLSETKHEVDECLTKTGLRPAKYLQSIGFLGEDVIVAHGCWLDPSEIEMLARAGAKVAHCPVSNMKLSTGPGSAERALTEAGAVAGPGAGAAAGHKGPDLVET